MPLRGQKGLGVCLVSYTLYSDGDVGTGYCKHQILEMTKKHIPENILFNSCAVKHQQLMRRTDLLTEQKKNLPLTEQQVFRIFQIQLFLQDLCDRYTLICNHPHLVYTGGKVADVYIKSGS